MTGFAAISQHNGWMIAALGATIVFSGLAVLAFIISRMPRIFAIFDRIRAPRPSAPAAGEALPGAKPEKHAAGDPAPPDIAAQIKSLAAGLPRPFQLTDLYRLCRQHDLPHPHLSLSQLQQKGVLHPEGGGLFTWRSEDEPPQEG